MLLEQLDKNELQIKGQIDFNEKIIKERQEGLDDAEALLLENRSLVQQINNKVHEQREDLVEIDHNVEEAKENAEEAEENIVKA